MKNGWTDAFMTGQPFENFLKEQDKRVETTLTESGAGMSTTEDPADSTDASHPDRPDYAQYVVCVVLVLVGALPDLRRACRCPAVTPRWIPLGPGSFRSSSASACW